MSSRKKNKVRAAAIRRIRENLPGKVADDVERVDAMMMATNPGDYLSTLPESVRKNFLEVAALLESDPEAFTETATLPVETITATVAALAYPDLVGNPTHEQRLEVAATLRIWHIAQMADTLFGEWPESISHMTNQDILDQIDADRDADLIPRPAPEE